MKYSHARILILTLTAIVVSGFLFTSQGFAPQSSQAAEKSLDIERYPDEPLELVDVWVGSNSVKGAITTKSRINGEGLDSTKFNNTTDWPKRVSLTRRNVSGKPVIGLRAYLYFKAAETGEPFQLPLEQELRQATAPGAEVKLVVGDRMWGLITNLIKQKGADPNLADVTLSVEAVMFTEDSQWYRGRMVRRDPASPNTWRNVATKPEGNKQKAERRGQTADSNPKLWIAFCLLLTAFCFVLPVFYLSALPRLPPVLQ